VYFKFFLVTRMLYVIFQMGVHTFSRKFSVAFPLTTQISHALVEYIIIYKKSVATYPHE
jgi:hypothetical protein